MEKRTKPHMLRAPDIAVGNEGFERGHHEGLRTGRDEGLRLGRDEGLKRGLDQGIREGKAQAVLAVLVRRPPKLIPGRPLRWLARIPP